MVLNGHQEERHHWGSPKKEHAPFPEKRLWKRNLAANGPQPSGSQAFRH